MWQCRRNIDRVSGMAELIMDLPESKRFPDKVLQIRRASFHMTGKTRERSDYSLRLPKTRPAGYTLYMRTRVEDRTVDLTRVKLEDYVAAAIKLVGEPETGKRVKAVARVSNLSKGVLKNVRCRLRLPFALVFPDAMTAAAARPVFEKMMPGETRTFELDLAVVAPMEAGSLVLDAESDNGGPHRAVLPVRIAP